MSLLQQIPECLKASDVERGNGRVKPPIPYLPETLKDLDPDRKVPTIKVKLKNIVEARIKVHGGSGNKEEFIFHMVNVRARGSKAWVCLRSMRRQGRV
jgi:hypothetical protein